MEKTFFERTEQWILMLVVVITVVWLWMSWRNGWFPFSSGATVAAPEKKEQQLSEKDVIDSLTSSVTSSTILSPAILKSLTSPVSLKTNEKVADTTSVLDSLTPSKK